MAKQAQGKRRSGGGQSSAPRQMARDPDQVKAERQNMAARADEIIRAVQRQRPAIEAVLPTNIGFDRFQATLTTALRHNPEILHCTTASIVQACCKAAYDGLALDGREAALVPHNVKVSKRNEPDRYEKQARYNPMVYGLIKQMIDSGIVADVHATLVYEGEPYKVIRGTREDIEHEEIPEMRGPSKKIRAVYVVARLTNGQIKFETMSAEDVAAVRAAAAYDFVWAKNLGEMTRKTVIRRLRKSIAGGRDIRDAEAMTMFPHFQNDRPAQLPAPARPDRRDYQQGGAPALEDQSVSVFDDFDRQTGEVFVDRADGREDQQQQRREAPTEEGDGKGQDRPRDEGAAGDDAPAGEGGGGAGAESAPAAETKEKAPARDWKPHYPVPEEPFADEAGWRGYATELIAAIPKITNVDDLNAERRAHWFVLEHAPEGVRLDIGEAFQEALTELVAGDGQ